MRIKFFLLLFIFASFSILQSSWNNIDNSIRNAVVKIFVAEKQINWFYPYNINSASCTGTGFFINELGYIITCAHVVKDASSVFIGIPFMGKQPLNAHVIGLCPQEDIALLQLDEDALKSMQACGYEISYLPLGDSNLLRRGEEVLVLGYPGTMESDLLKSTVGVISFNNGSVVQFDAALNPGNSGGPLLNKDYQVIGVCKSIDRNGVNQGISFAVPINIATLLLPHLHNNKLFEIDDFGIIIANSANLEMKKYFNCPIQEGCYICNVIPTKQAHAVGLQANDILYDINGYSIDNFGEIISPFNGERISFFDYINQLEINSKVELSIYRNGESLQFTLTRTSGNPTISIPYKYPAYEGMEFEIFGGLIVMPLTINYINACQNNKPALRRYLTSLYDQGPRLVIANVIAGSEVSKMQTIRYADTINEVNGEIVKTLDDFRKALLKSIDTGFVTIKTTDELTLNTDNVMTILSLYNSCKETLELSLIHNYPLSDTVKQLIKQVDSSLL